MSSSHSVSNKETHDIDMTPHAAALKKELDDKEARLKKQQQELDERRAIFEAKRSEGAGANLATQNVMEQIKAATETRDALTNDIGIIEVRIATAQKKLKEKATKPACVCLCSCCKTLPRRCWPPCSCQP